MSRPTAWPVEARYIPKTVTHQRDGDGFAIRIRAMTFWSMILGFAAIFAAVFIAPGFALVGGFFGWLIAFGGFIALAVYVFRRGGPTVYLSPDGVQIGSKKYRFEDIQDFREGSDDSWIAQAFRFTGMEFLGIQYGIYSVRTPFILPKIESLKVAPYLSNMLKTLNEQVGKDRDRKIQQTTVF
jgi:hypothetical protein